MAVYVALLERTPLDTWGVWFPDLVGCTSGGKTPDDAIQNAHQALRLHLEGMMEDGDPIPAPSEIEAIANNPEYAKQIPFLVRIEIEKSEPVRLNISLDKRLVIQIDEAAARLGKTRSAFLADAARAELRKA
ncbi:MAG TPA: type II toxin-antitoxin system HicB family antitoxin [Pantanalinema sp.]